MQRAFSLFRLVQEREITGVTPLNWPGRQPDPSPSTALINAYLQNRQPEQLSTLVPILKTHALQGDEVATRFFISLVNNHRQPHETRNLLIAHLSEIAAFRQEAEWFYEIFKYRLPMQPAHPSQYDPRQAIDALCKAATLQGEFATKAAVILAHLYATELGLLVRPGANHQISLKDLYLRFCNADSAPNIRRAGMTHFAELGCRQAISDLMRGNVTHAIGENMAPATNSAQHWQQRLQTNQAYLGSRFLHYYELALQNTLRFGPPNYIADGFPHDIIELIDLCANYHSQQHPPIRGHRLVGKLQIYAEVKTKFIAAALEGNLVAAEFLALHASNPDNHWFAFEPGDATHWNQHILDSRIPDCKIVHRAAQRLFEAATPSSDHPVQDYTQRQLKLLQTAYQLGCPESALKLAGRAMTYHHAEPAMDYINFALVRSTSASITRSLVTLLATHQWHQDARYIPFCYQVFAQDILRSPANARWVLVLIINECMKLNDQTLAGHWRKLNLDHFEITRMPPEEIDALADKTARAMVAYYHNSPSPRWLN